jgi:serine/threonine-protein kinase
MITPTRVGSVIAGKYRVERVLGRGGMGVVVVARHLQLGERVAIKFPIAGLGARGRLVDRWVREGRAAMRIRSQHVARVYDVGTLETGEPYLVMEYLVGRDLATVLADDGPLPVSEAVECILHSVEALAEAHAQGIVHRDLKPSNLFLTCSADGSAVTKVLDFGTAKTVSLAMETTLTSQVGMIGTPLFMAPEQMRSHQEIDARADIWALGATLHTLLTGKPPFSGGSILEIHESIVRGAPFLCATRPDAPPALEAALQRCMRMEPSDRYATVAELADALAEVAPEHARISAVRATRILSTAPRVADGADSTSELAFGKSDSRLAQSWRTDPSTDASWPDAEARETAGTRDASLARPSPDGAATIAPRRRRSRSWLVLAFAGAAVLASGLDAVVRVRPHGLALPSVGQAVAIPEPAAPSASPSLEGSHALPYSSASSPPPLLGSATGREDGAPLVPHDPSSPLGVAPLVRSTRSVKVPDAGRLLPIRDPLADPN